MKCTIPCLLCLFSLVACTPPREKTITPGGIAPIGEAEQVAWEKQHQAYRISFEPEEQDLAKQLGNHQWQIAPDTKLIFLKSKGRELSDYKFESDSRYALEVNGKRIKTEKKSFEYYGSGREADEWRRIHASTNAFIIDEACAWSTQQYILFTRADASSPWQSRYIRIPQSPQVGVISGVDIFQISDTHLIVKDAGKFYRYPFSMLRTIVTNHPFTIG